MCNNVSIKTKGYRLLEKQVKLPFRADHRVLYIPYYEVSGSMKPFLPVIANEQIQMARWRLVPSWVKDEGTFKTNTLNARSDELFESGTYRNYWENRCVLLCTGFFEPHAVPGRKTKESWFVGPKNGGILKLGCIYSHFQGKMTFSIMTTPASYLLTEVHNSAKRMPLILDEEKANAWLLPDITRDEMAMLMTTPVVDHLLDAYRVMDGVTDTRVDTNVPEVLEPIQDSWPIGLL